MIAASACALLAGCDESPNPGSGSTGTPTQSVVVVRPRVAMLNATTAVISYYQDDPSAPKEQWTLRYELSTSATELVARSNANIFLPAFHLSATGNGVGIHVTPRSGDNTTQGCAIRTIGPIACTTLADKAMGDLAVVAPLGGGQAIALYGNDASVMESSFNPLDSSWSASRSGPALPRLAGVDARRTVARWVDGSVFLVLTSLENDVYGMFAMQYEPQQGTWQNASVLESGLRPTDPQVVLHPASPTKSPLAVWTDPNLGPGGQPHGINFAVWNSATGWSTPAPIPGSLRARNSATAAMWLNGDAIVVWQRDDKIVGVRRVSGTWQAPETIGNSDGSDDRIELAVDDQGNAVAMWSCRGADCADLRSANYIAGAGWQAESVVGPLAKSATHDNFSLAMDPGGRAVAVWARPAGGADPGSRLAIAEVGPQAFALTAQRYTFGGDSLPLTLRIANPPSQATTISLSTTLPGGSISLPTSIALAANQGEVTVDVPTSTVATFSDGVVVATYGNASVSRAVTLMPEPSGVMADVAPAVVPGGTSATLSLAVTPVYPVPLTIALSSDNAVAPVPAQVTTGSTSLAAVPIATMMTVAAQTATFTAQFRGRTGTASLRVDPTPVGQSVLTVAVPLGHGSVSSSPAGVTACTVSCSTSFTVGTPVTLTPSAAPGFRFLAWEGHPDCSDGMVTMTTARNCSAIFTPVPAGFAGGSGWTTLARGDVSFQHPAPVMALDRANPVVAFVLKQTATSVSQLVVRRIEGNAFPILGDNGSNLNVSASAPVPLDASEPAIVATDAGLPYVAWIESSGAQQNVYVARLAFGGGTPVWTLVGGAAPLNYVAGSRASSPSLSLDNELRPMVAWIEDGAVKFKRFDGTAWIQAVGGEGPASAGADRVRLSSLEGSVPSIAWTQGASLGRALKVVRDFNFTPLGTQVNPAGTNTLVEFAVLGEAATAFVVWGDTRVVQGSLATSIRTQSWDVATRAWRDLTSFPLVNLNPDTLVGLAMSRTRLDVAYAFSSVTTDRSYLHVGNYASGAFTFVAIDYSGTRAQDIGPIQFDAFNSASPIAVVVERLPGNVTYDFNLVQYLP